MGFGGVGEAADDGHAGDVGVGGCCELFGQGFCEGFWEGFCGLGEGDGAVGEGTDEGWADGHVGLFWGG